MDWIMKQRRTSSPPGLFAMNSVGTFRIEGKPIRWLHVSSRSVVSTEIEKLAGLPTEVAAGKNGALYNAHSYPTKIPPEAIQPFVDYFTRPGDHVLDPFCGSGMTGVAATRLNRLASLSDLSPGAAHLAANHV